METIVYSKKDLNKAIKSGEKSIVVRGKLARKIQLLGKVNKSKVTNLSEDMSVYRTAGLLVGLPVSVAITVVITLGVVAIIAILKNYRIVIKKKDVEIVLEKEVDKEIKK